MLLGVRERRAQRARPRRAPPARVRAVRRAVVRVLAAPPAGESGDGRDDREGDRGSRARPLVIWAKAEGCRVTLTDGRELLDLSGGFGVAALGHRNPRILEAWREQEVVHALGDLADAEVTVRFRDALPWPAKLGVTGEDAVEIALRTAHLATGRPGIVAFDGAYHGTGLLALAATGFEQFRAPWQQWLPGPVHRRPYGEDPGPLPGRHGVRDRRAGAGTRGLARAARRLPRDAAPALRRGRRAARRRRDLRRARARRRAVARRRRRRHRSASARRSAAGCRSRPRSSSRDGLEPLWQLGDADVYTHTHVGNPLACAAALVVLDEVPGLLDHVTAMGERFERGGLGRPRPPARARRQRRRRARARRARHSGRPRRLAHPGDAAAHDHRAPTSTRRSRAAASLAPRVQEEGAGHAPLARVLLERLEAEAGAHERRHDPAEPPEALLEVVVAPVLQAVDAERDGMVVVHEQLAARAGAPPRCPRAQASRSARFAITPSGE